jgi:hypothetical protein
MPALPADVVVCRAPMTRPAIRCAGVGGGRRKSDSAGRSTDFETQFGLLDSLLAAQRGVESVSESDTEGQQDGSFTCTVRRLPDGISILCAAGDLSGETHSQVSRVVADELAREPAQLMLELSGATSVDDAAVEALVSASALAGVRHIILPGRVADRSNRGGPRRSRPDRAVRNLRDGRRSETSPLAVRRAEGMLVAEIAVLSPRGEYPLAYSLRREQDIDVRHGDAWSAGTPPCKHISERSPTWPNVSKV